LHFLAPAVLDYAANGRVEQGVDNYDPNYAPHGVYPSLGDDRWIAIACRTDQQWNGLCAAMNRSDMASDERFATLTARLLHRDQLDRIIAAWTRGLVTHDAEVLLQGLSVPAAALQDSRALCEDPQLGHRGYITEIEHPVYGTTAVEGSRFLLSRTPAQIRRPAPTVGGDNRYVLETILGYDRKRIDELVAANIVE
jgi:crotonobetainyl-CoA:carnitine CoA-transferase CaiB-like acyl-CoA transferase